MSIWASCSGDGVVFLDDAIDLAADMLLVERLLGQIEVQPPAAVITNRATGDPGTHHRTQHVKHRVHAHQAMPARPVDLRDHVLPD